MAVGKNINTKRKEKGMSLEELSKFVGVSRQTLSRYENDIISVPSDRIERIAEVLETTPAYLMGWEDEDIFSIPGIMPIKKKKIPFLGEIRCGEPTFASEERESYIEVGTEIRADFCLKAKGDSMQNARILDGDIVFIRQQDSVENGEIAAVIIDNDTTLKRVNYFPEKDLLILKAENPAYPDLVYTKEELNSIRILGKAIAFQSDVK